MKKYLSALLGASFAVTSCSKESPNGDSNHSNSEVESTSSSEYPLDVCVVSGKKLGSMGEPYSIKHEGTTVKFCCKHCLPKFQKNPAKYIESLNK